MNINAKGVGILVVVFGGAVVIAYSIGTKKSMQADGATQTGVAAPITSPGQPPTGQQQAKSLFPDQGQSPLSPASQAGQKFTHFRVGNRNVKGLYADDDAVWVGTSGGVIRYDIKSEQHKLYDVTNGSLVSNGVFYVSKLDDRIMIGTYGGGVSVFDLKTKQWKNYNIPDGLADQFVYDIEADTNGNYWIATWSGVNFVSNGNMDDPKSWKTYTVENTKGGLPNDWVYGVETGLNGDMWFATEGGLARLDKQGVWTNWQHEDGLGAPYEKVKKDISFTNDPAKTSRHHATQKKQQGLSNIKVGFNPNYIVSMVVGDDGVVWCGTWGGGLSRFDGKTWKTYTVTEGLPGNHVFMLKKTATGRMWIGTNNGLTRFNKEGSGFTTLTKADGLFANNVFSLAEAADGSLWVGGFGGVSRLQGLNL